MFFPVARGQEATAQVIEYSINRETNKPILTYLLTYPRFIHGEFMTHRVFSRNASSSRAIPVNRMIATIMDDPAFFVHVGLNQPGMQAKAEVDAETKAKFRAEWNELLKIVAGYSERWANEYHIHKQVANRPLEAWMRMKVVVTSTEWDNFFLLRDHPDAQPEIQDLAKTMLLAKATAEPRYLAAGDLNNPKGWHLPFVTMDERQKYPVRDLLRASTARCARTSYNNFDMSNPEWDKDIALHDQLVVAEPLHASPAEHQAGASKVNAASGNFNGGWLQYRQFLEAHGAEKFFNVLEGKVALSPYQK